MDSIKIAICEEQQDTLEIIEEQIKYICKKNRIPAGIKNFKKPSHLMMLFSDNPYIFDIVLLDIDMKEMDGNVCAKELRRYSKTFNLILVTSRVDKVYTSFAYNTNGFILKSMLEKFLEECILCVCDKLKNEKETMLLFEVRSHSAYEKIKVPISNILYFESSNRKIYMYTVDHVFELKQTGFEKFKTDMCEKYRFVEIHRLCIVNVANINSIRGDQLKLDNNKVLVISRRNVKTVENAFEEYFK